MVPRGLHAHYTTKQILICIQGFLQVSLYDGKNSNNYLLHSGESIFVDKLIWDEEVYLTNDTIMLSLCSTTYCPEDYLCSKKEFENIVNKNKERKN